MATCVTGGNAGKIAEASEQKPAEYAAGYKRNGSLEESIHADCEFKRDSGRGEGICFPLGCGSSRRATATTPQAREQIDQGLDGDPAASGKARTILREMLGEIMLSP